MPTFNEVLKYGIANKKKKEDIINALIQSDQYNATSSAMIDKLSEQGAFGVQDKKTVSSVGEIPLSPTEQSKTRMTVETTDVLKRKLTEYKKFIDEKGFSGSFWGADDLGKAETLRGMIISDIKDAKQLGTLDSGLLTFAENLVGQKPEKTITNMNLFGRASKRISAGLEQYINEIDKDAEKYREILGVRTEKTGESSDEIENKFNTLHSWAEANPDDERAKKFLDDWNNDRFDLNTGKIKEQYKELTPYQKKLKEQKEKFEQETALTDEEMNQLKGEQGYADNIVKGETGLISNLAEDFGNLKRNIVQTGEDAAKSYKEVSDATSAAIEALKSGDMERYKIEAEKAKANSKLMNMEGLIGVAGTLGKFVADLGTTGLEAADDATRNIVSNSFKGAVNTVIDELNQTEDGRAGLQALQRGGDGWNKWMKEHPDTAKDIGNVMGVIEGVTTVLGTRALKEGAKTATKGVMSIAKTGAEKTSESLATAGQKIRHPFKATGGVIDSTHGKIIENRLAKAGGLADEVKSAATKTGFDEKQASLISSMNPKDKDVARKLIDLAEKASIDPRVIQRPTDIVGQNLIKKQKPIEILRNQFGKEVDEAAKSLRGKQIDTTPLVKKVESVLDDLNITRSEDGFDFENSVFKNVPAVQKQITNAFNDIDNLGNDAYKTHILKKSIDEIVDYGTEGEGLKGTAGVTLKNLRREADKLLDEGFKNYKTSNEKYSEIRDVLDASSDVFGKKKITEQKAGQAMRRIFSNAGSRGDVMELLEKIDTVAKKYNIETGENLLDQALFTEVLEDLYGSQATTSLQGEVKKALTAVEIVRNPLTGIPKAAAEGIETITARTPDARKEFIKQLLKKPDKKN